MKWKSIVREVRREVYSGEYVCPACGRVFPSLRSLISHIVYYAGRGDEAHEKLVLAFNRGSKLRKKVVAKYR